ncbi:hypothetical protein ACQX01_10605, partial [Corynebacterium diphtheriae]
VFVVFSYSRLRKPMVGAWVWVWWWWGFRDHGFVIMVSYWRKREHTNNPLAQKHTFARVRFRRVLVFETT